MSRNLIATALQTWSSVLGTDPLVVDRHWSGELWRIRGNGEWYLKRLSHWRNLPIEDEVVVVRFVNRAGLRVAQHAMTDAGSAVAEVDAVRFTLLPHLSHDEFEPDELPDVDYRVGIELAKLHHALRAYSGPVDSYEERWDRIPLDSDLFGLHIITAYSARSGEASRLFELLPKQLVHGDMTPENVLVGKEPGSRPGFIDFDHLPSAPRVWDIARYLSRRLRQSQRDGPDIRLRCIDGLVRGYASVQELSNQEVRALPYLMVTANILEARYHKDILDGVLQRRRIPDQQMVLQSAIAAVEWQFRDWDEVVSVVEIAADS